MGRENIEKLIQGVSDNRTRRIFQLLAQEVDALSRSVVTLTASGGGGGGVSSTPSGHVYSWVANGPYRVDTEVDGARSVVATGMISAVHFIRTDPGTSGSTILDLNRNGSSIYTTTGNRPTLVYTDADEKIICALPDSTSVALGDSLTVDTDAVESGVPMNWCLEVVVDSV